MSETLDRLRSALGRRYEIDRELGRGGMATIYSALDKKHNRPVALKVFPPALAAAIGPERFEREIAITSRLNHPHILPLYDSGTAAGTLYYVMPLIRGESLRARLDRDADGLPLSEIRNIGTQIAKALDYAHESGIVHRDVTPDNILLADGSALLADFGIARLVEGESLTESGLPIGTAMYRSPEQASGHSKVDASSDIYSFGAVLYESAAGTKAKPHLANRFAAPVPPLRKLRPDAPPGMEAALVRAMSTNPAVRQRSAGALVGEMLSPVPLRQRLRRLRWPALATLVIAGGLLAFSFFERPSPTLVRNGVLVARFVNHTGDKSLDDIADMATDYIARGLAETRLVDVIDSRTMAPGESIAAATSIFGSFYKRGDSLHFETHVIDNQTGRVVASTDPVDASIEDPASGVERIRQHVMGTFAATRGPGFEAWEGASLPPSYEAYQEILDGDRATWQMDYETAMAHYRRAASMDTTFVRARAMLALAASLAHDCALVDSIFAKTKLHDRMSPADRGTLDFSKASCDGNREGALEAGRRVMQAAPRSVSFSVLLGITAINDLRPREGLAVLESVSPEQMQFTAAERSFRADFIAIALHAMGDHRKELGTIRDAIRAMPDDPHLRTDELVALAALGRVDEMRSRRAELIDGSVHYDRHLWNPAQINTCIAMELATHGHQDEAQRVMSEAASWLHSHIPAKGSLGDDVLCAFGSFVPFYYVGDLESARSLYQSMLKADTLDLRAHEALGAIAARAHDAREMTEMDEWLAHHSEIDPARTRYSRARIALLAGDRRAALKLLREARGHGLGYWMFEHMDPDMAPLRTDPEYQELFRIRG